MRQTFELPVAMGDEVKDRVTGFTGIVVAAYFYFNRCARVCVQPRVDKEGKIPAAEVFDVEQMDIVQSRVVEQKADRESNPNGPMPTPELFR